MEQLPQPQDWMFDATEQNFQQVVLDESHRRLVVLDISAEWCAPCRVLMPIMEQVAQAYQGRFLLAKLDADENMRIAGRYQVKGFPTVIAFVNGEEVGRFHSAQTKAYVEDFIEKLIDITGS